MPAQFLLPQCLLAGFPPYSPFPRSANSVADCTVPKLKPHSLPTPHSHSNSHCSASWIQPLPLHSSCPHLSPRCWSPLLHWHPSWSFYVLCPHSSAFLSVPPSSSAFFKAILLLKSLHISSHKSSLTISSSWNSLVSLHKASFLAYSNAISSWSLLISPQVVNYAMLQAPMMFFSSCLFLHFQCYSASVYVSVSATPLGFQEQTPCTIDFCAYPTRHRAESQ